jgi:hypothetical protein
MRASRRLAWNIANGMVILALVRQWAYHDTRHDLLDSATIGMLAIGFLAGCVDRLRGSKNTRDNVKETDRRDALLVFPAEGLEPEVASPPSHAPNRQIAWFTFLMHAALMIALSWRWAFQHEPYTILGAVTLSTLMLGFLDASVTAFASLGRSASTRSLRKSEEQSALLLFPAEDSAVNAFVPAPRLLATRRKALL